MKDDLLHEARVKDDDLLYEAWGVIANAGNAPTNWRINGTTDHLTPLEREWVEAAERWRNKWHDTLVVKGMGHEMVVTLSERRGLAVQFRCNMDVDAPCRTRCPQHCESDCEHDKEPGHPCAYLPWMDGDMYGDYYVGPDVPAFASGPVEFVWNGDGYDWRYQDGWFEQ